MTPFDVWVTQQTDGTDPVIFSTNRLRWCLKSGTVRETNVPRQYAWGSEPDETDDWLTHPDLHSHTWATIAELRAAPWDDVDSSHSGALRQSGFALWVFGPEMDALVAETGSPDRVRVLMAFDN